MTASRKPLEPKFKALTDKAFAEEDFMWIYSPGEYIMYKNFEKYAQRVLDFEVKEDDVWLISYPRTGSHWVQEMTWLVGHDCDFELASQTKFPLRAPMLENSAYMFKFADYINAVIPETADSVSFVESLKSPRFIKSHVPEFYLPTKFNQVKPKLIYICRNPKDVLVSFYYFVYNVFDMKHITLDEFAELFVNGRVVIGDCIDHYLRYWKRRNDPNFLFLKFEDVKKDTKGTVLKVSKFLGKELSDEKVDQLIDHLSIEKSRGNEYNFKEMLEFGQKIYDGKQEGSMFIRKGLANDWKSELKPETVKMVDDYVAKGLAGSGLSFE